jgi:hypothetical protein
MLKFVQTEGDRYVLQQIVDEMRWLQLQEVPHPPSLPGIEIAVLFFPHTTQQFIAMTDPK